MYIHIYTHKQTYIQTYVPTYIHRAYNGRCHKGLVWKAEELLFYAALGCLSLHPVEHTESLILIMNSAMLKLLAPL